jgi:drug/metabolite transporter (DMT)-like permease
LRQKTIGILLILSAAVLFGINGSLSRLLFDNGVTPVTLVEFRMIIGGLCLFGFLGIQHRQTLKLPRRAFGWIIAFGLSMALVTYTYFVSISRVPIAVTLVIQFTAPAWLMLGGSLWRRCVPSWHVLIAGALAVGGVVLVTGIWQQSLNGLDGIGLLFALFALVTFILYLMMGRKVGAYLHPISGTAYGALVASLFWLIIQPPWSVPASTWNPHTFVLIVLVGIIGMALPFSLEMAGLRRLDATRAGIAAMFELPASAVVAFFWLGQDLNLWQTIGCGLVLAGITIVQLEKPDGQKRQPNHESV